MLGKIGRSLPSKTAIIKLWRFICIYGVRRALFKAAGRLRVGGLGHIFARRSTSRDIAMIGCGQFAFATIGYFISKNFGCRFRTCYDVNPTSAGSFAKFYGIETPSGAAQDAMLDPSVKVVYVASNHASHADYAQEAMRLGKSVYIEKPVAVTWTQLAELTAAVRRHGSSVFAGYNRPFSSAIRDLRNWCHEVDTPMTLSCFISGHHLEADHWYRAPAEGTRICGNVGHWLDLAVHMLHWGTLPDRWTISLVWSNQEARDDDMSITLVSTRGDLISIVLTSRTEPFEGINETINLQWGKTIGKIDDFRRLTLWRGARVKKCRYRPKDVGHQAAILQPFNREPTRNWQEVELSTLWTLKISEMVKQRIQTAEFSFSEQQALLKRAALERAEIHPPDAASPAFTASRAAAC